MLIWFHLLCQPTAPGKGFGRRSAHGWRCDVRAFIGAQRRSARAFLGLMRHSQLFEMFVRERLLLASQGYPVTCAFEAKARVPAL